MIYVSFLFRYIVPNAVHVLILLATKWLALRSWREIVTGKNGHATERLEETLGLRYTCVYRTCMDQWYLLILFLLIMVQYLFSTGQDVYQRPLIALKLQTSWSVFVAQAVLLQQSSGCCTALGTPFLWAGNCLNKVDRRLENNGSVCLWRLDKLDRS